MRLRTFTAPDMPTAIKLAREAMGDSAIIIASEPLAGKKLFKITAAIDGPDEDAMPRPVSKQDHATADHVRFEVKNILHFHNIPELFIAKLMQKAADSELSNLLAAYSNHDISRLSRLALAQLLKSYFRFSPLHFLSPQEGRTIIMLIGPPGVGKTLAIAKLAARLTMEKRPPAIITTDNKRAGGIDQLQAYTNILGLDLQIADNESQLAQQLKDFGGRMPVLIDTAGCNPFDDADMQELQSYAAIKGIEPVLALAAGGDSLEAIDMVEAFAAFPIERLLVTRTDTARRFGGVLAAAAASSLIFCNAGSSSSVTDPIRPVDAALLAQLLLKYKESQLQTP